MKVKFENTAHERGRRSFAHKMTVEMPTSVMTELKIHAARRHATVRKIVIEAVENHLKHGEQS